MQDTPAPPSSSLADRKVWIRLLYLVLFGIVMHVVGLVLGLLAFVQACALLATGEPFRELSAFGGRLADYTRHIVQFLTLATDERPFPFAGTPWNAQARPAREPLGHDA